MCDEQNGSVRALTHKISIDVSGMTWAEFLLNVLMSRQMCWGWASVIAGEQEGGILLTKTKWTNDENCIVVVW